jgi:hypothetical protein
MRAAAVGVAIATGLLVSAAVTLLVVLQLDSSYQPQQSIVGNVPDALMTIAFALVGAVLLLKRPGNLVGWALSLAGVGTLLGGVLGAYGEIALLAKPELDLPGGAAAGVINDGSWTPLMAGTFLLLVVFPAGRVPSPRWRSIVTVVLAGYGAIWVGIATAPSHLDPPLDSFENSLAVTSNRNYIVPFLAIIGVCLVLTAVAGINLIVRFRRSRGLERQQFKWLAASAALLVVSLPLATLSDFSGAAGIPFGIALLTLPFSVGIAVLRYRLYEIDVVINRTLVYGSLTALLAGAYVGLVLLFQLALHPLTGGSGLAIALSTLAVAALFRPARARIQALVDRRFYRRKYDAARTLEAFAARLREEVDLDALRVELASVVAETMQPAHVSVWLRAAAPVTPAVTISRRLLSTKETR